jgi:hypothetical protein
VFCYDLHSITVPVAEVAMSTADRVLDVTMHIGLGYTTLYASGVETSIYSVTPTQIHARTHLVVRVTDHFLYLIPSRKDEPSIVDAVATLINSQRLLVQAWHTSTLGNYRQWGTWHADFHRVPNPDPTR